MSATQALRASEAVADWPKVVASIHGPSDQLTDAPPTYIGSITINGTERPCEATSVEELRTGMIARCVAIAIRLHRPVRLTVKDSSQTWTLGVRPEGIVQLLDAAGTIPPADGLTVHEGRCRICRRLQPVTEAVCVQCKTPEPHRVEADPIDVKAVVPDAATTVEELPVVRAVVVPVEELDHTVMAKPTPPPVTRPRLRLSFTTQEPVDTSESVVLGRHPIAVGDRKPIAVESPERMLSRTHALIDVDDEGRIVVTDYHSGNGIETQTDPPRRFEPGVPYTIEPGTSLRMGDVVCTIEVTPSEAK